MIADEIIREPLLKTMMAETPINAMDVRRITFRPGQQTGRHRHPCPVLGYIVEGTALLEVEGEASRELPAGSAFYEPAEALIRRFDNASSRDPLIFVAVYLLKGQ